MKKRLTIILIIIAFFFSIIIGMWVSARNTAIKNGTQPMSFKEFIGLGTPKGAPIPGSSVTNDASPTSSTESPSKVLDSSKKTSGFKSFFSLLSRAGVRLSGDGSTSSEFQNGGNTAGNGSSGNGAIGGIDTNTTGSLNGTSGTSNASGGASTSSNGTTLDAVRKSIFTPSININGSTGAGTSGTGTNSNSTNTGGSTTGTSGLGSGTGNSSTGTRNGNGGTSTGTGNGGTGTGSGGFGSGTGTGGWGSGTGTGGWKIGGTGNFSGGGLGYGWGSGTGGLGGGATGRGTGLGGGGPVGGGTGTGNGDLPIDPGLGNVDTLNQTTSGCTSADTNIAFTAEEIDRLNTLQERFYAIAQTIHTDADVKAELANYDNFKLKLGKITELKNYCETKAPHIPSSFNTVRIQTPFWRDPKINNKPDSSKVFTDPQKIGPVQMNYNPANIDTFLNQTTAVGGNGPWDLGKAVLEIPLRISLW